MFQILPAVLCTAIALMAVTGPGQAADAGNGESVYKKRCRACHTVEPEKNLVGPSLFGVVGRQAGTVPKYRYSDSYVTAGQGGLSWTKEQIVEYLEDPRKFMREVTGDDKARTKMVLKLKPQDEREDVAEFLETLN